jgi:hypothetical protein
MIIEGSGGGGQVRLWVATKAGRSVESVSNQGWLDAWRNLCAGLDNEAGDKAPRVEVDSYCYDKVRERKEAEFKQMMAEAEADEEPKRSSARA